MDFDLDLGRELRLDQGDSEDTSYTGQMKDGPGTGKTVGISKKTEQKNGGKYAKKKAADDAKMDKKQLNKGGKTRPPDEHAGGY